MIFSMSRPRKRLRGLARPDTNDDADNPLNEQVDPEFEHPEACHNSYCDLHDAHNSHPVGGGAKLGVLGLAELISPSGLQDRP
jgi:hypothetical protein